MSLVQSLGVSLVPSGQQHQAQNQRPSETVQLVQIGVFALLSLAMLMRSDPVVLVAEIRATILDFVAEIRTTILMLAPTCIQLAPYLAGLALAAIALRILFEYHRGRLYVRALEAESSKQKAEIEANRAVQVEDAKARGKAEEARIAIAAAKTTEAAARAAEAKKEEREAKAEERERQERQEEKREREERLRSERAKNAKGDGCAMM
ncbi:unnamed protein product [Symbiodinium natans]|uniref:Uncharacterized protein n=1 Tax=Symbiodinium natans TaxID=878477 RepID=A0A812S0U2_9DINO|nr:unnamed protein product [Symbiodinium natans]